MNTSHNKTMRSIYYAYIARIIAHPVVVQGAVLLAAIWWLKELVFVARIWESFATTPVGEVGGFVYELFTQADSLTVIVTIAVCYIAISWVRRLSQIELVQLPMLRSS